ncbi:MAG: hypothetical protein ACF8MF_10970 [Phycisphaerales bacterium JB052]
MIFGLVTLIIAAAISGLIVGLVTMIAGKLVLQDPPEFGDAFKACFYAAIVNGVSQFVLGLAMGEGNEWLILSVSLALTYVVYVFMFMSIIGYTLGQALAVGAVALAITFGLMIGAAVVLGSAL